MKNQPLHKEKAGFLGATKIPWPIFQLTADGILAGFSIELRTYNIIADMESGDIPWDETDYDRLTERYDALTEVLLAILGTCRDGRIAYLTGPQIGLAKEAVAWAAETRAKNMVKIG